ncbi:hypothetical protein SERLA73DRAFT_149355 [Serpula lacrymans var. lacrymans S7.3]|uniref:Uncharacterized protein n=1 Tax=Serpula lacrymans var. lacrymans (strain S7.3) TaxID=936435 RepID=F8PI06_SERL3|nr:hypothetical protein SERLA73DRAFT_149355 [Serpula lacrymans var. lacrymans S7.3]
MHTCSTQSAPTLLNLLTLQLLLGQQTYFILCNTSLQKQCPITLLGSNCAGFCRSKNLLLMAQVTQNEALHKELNYIHSQISTYRKGAHMWEVCWAEEACQCDLMQCYISEEDLKFQVLRLIAVITELSAHNENTPSAHQVRVILSVVTVDSVPSALYPAKEVAIFNKAAAFFAPNTQGLVPGQIVTGKEITFKNVEYLEPHSILKKLGRKDTLSIRYYWDVISKILIMFGPPSSIHKASTEHLCNCFLKAMGVQDASVGTDNISNPMSMWDVSTAESFKVQSNETSDNRPNISIERPQIGLIFPVETYFTKT